MCVCMCTSKSVCVCVCVSVHVNPYLGVDVFNGLEAHGVFAALARVGPAADTVHCHRESLVALTREGAEGHAAGREPVM